MPTKNLCLFTHDVPQAYLQSRGTLTCDGYFRPKVSDRHLFNANDDELLKLDNTSYRLCDSGDYKNATMKNYLTKNINMVEANF